MFDCIAVLQFKPEVEVNVADLREDFRGFLECDTAPQSREDLLLIFLRAHDLAQRFCPG